VVPSGHETCVRAQPAAGRHHNDNDGHHVHHDNDSLEPGLLTSPPAGRLVARGRRPRRLVPPPLTLALLCRLQEAL
jgi:hypothetical protein